MKLNLNLDSKLFHLKESLKLFSGSLGLARCQICIKLLDLLLNSKSEKVELCVSLYHLINYRNNTKPSEPVRAVPERDGSHKGHKGGDEGHQAGLQKLGGKTKREAG